MPRRPRSFASLLGWTTLSAFVPGSSLAAAGKKVGWVPITLLAFVLGAALALYFSPQTRERALDLALRYAVDDRALTTAMVVLIVLATIWVIIMVTGHAALRNRRYGLAQNLVAFSLLAVLAALVIAPTFLGVRTLTASRQALSTVFDEAGLDPGAAQATGADPWATRPRINVLLIGSDAGADRTGIRPDTMIVASINTATGDSTLVSLPRNLEGITFPTTAQTTAWQKGCKVNGSGGCMLNAVWLYGEQNATSFGSDPGMQATTEAIETVTGLKIDYNALVNLDGFTDLVDSLGGIDVVAPRDIPIGGGTNTATGGKYPITGYIKAGPQHLDGYEALWYVRSREGSDNNDRMQRQRCVIGKAVQQFDVLALARTFPKLAASAERNVQTSIRGSELPAFIELGRQVQRGQMSAVTINSDIVNPAKPDYDQIQELIFQALNPVPAPAAPTTAPVPDVAPDAATPGPAQPTAYC